MNPRRFVDATSRCVPVVTTGLDDGNGKPGVPDPIGGNIGQRGPEATTLMVRINGKHGDLPMPPDGGAGRLHDICRIGLAIRADVLVHEAQSDTGSSRAERNWPPAT